MKRVVFSTAAYEYLQKELCKNKAFQKGTVERDTFPDGERYQRIVNNVLNRDVAIIGGTISDSDTLELYDLACAAVKYGARTLTLVIPYFGYSTMERAVKEGEVVKAKTRARLFSSVPRASIANKVILIDLHSEGIPHYFEGDVIPVHLYAKELIKQAIRKLARGSFVMACTDAGRAKWVESLANDLGVPASFVFKKRLDGKRTQVTAVSAHVKGKDVIIYDDMIRTGGSLINAAKAYSDAGAKSISVVATHGVFPGNALKKIEDSKLIKSIICTNTHPNVLKHNSLFLKTASVAPLLVSYLESDL